MPQPGAYAGIDGGVFLFSFHPLPSSYLFLPSPSPFLSFSSLPLSLKVGTP